MVRLDTKLMTVALSALAVGCGGGSHQPETPAAVSVPAPAAQPQGNGGPQSPSAPSPKGDPKVAPKDSGDSAHFPWQSGPIAAL